MVMIKWLKQLLDRGADIESYSKPTQQSKKDREQAVQYRLTHGKNRCFNSQCKKVEECVLLLIALESVNEETGRFIRKSARVSRVKSKSFDSEYHIMY